MDSKLYRAAQKGEIEDFKQTKPELELHQLLTPDNNTVLHIHITSLTEKRGEQPNIRAELEDISDEGKTAFVREILKLCPALLRQPNKRGDTPLHVAARYGHGVLVKFLIEQAKADDRDGDVESGDKAVKEMLRSGNSVKDTALHEAARFGHVEVARVLVEEDCGFQYDANNDGETPVYIAAERRHREIVSLMLEKCTTVPLATGGPCGRTVLHAAVIMNSGVMTKEILEKMGHLTKQPDDRGWVPLHFAVHQNLMPIVKYLLLRRDEDAAYIKNGKGRTALHLAASKGYHKMMTEILSCRPDCGELVDDRGWNALHFAVKSNNIRAVKVILNDSSLSNLLNGKDFEGNTPLHIATALGHTKIQRTLLSLSSGVDKMAFNKKNQNAFDIALTTRKADLKNRGRLLTSLMRNDVLNGNRIWIYQDEDDLKEFEENDFNADKAQESTLVVATLIATMTFAAGFTLPGGYISDAGPLQGTAILSQNTAFQAFMITDTLAMVLSSVSVLIQLFLILREDETRKLKYHTTAYFLTMFSMGAMVIAFVTGTYAVLAPTIALAVATCVIGLSFFVFFYVLFSKTFGVF